ncbi:hypothetical protein [uncultured Tateyamaria sp.]|uniref:hypothetical protein n=1 Tax=uncultured Tateyamaria sp. TaxID=455651 RepID=UPI00262B0EBA|nr:hypothetical protein [uncultured Tateyamaria sp.]
MSTITREHIAAVTGRKHDYLTSLLRTLPFTVRPSGRRGAQKRYYNLGDVIVAIKRKKRAKSTDAEICALVDVAMKQDEANEQ